MCLSAGQLPYLDEGPIGPEQIAQFTNIHISGMNSIPHGQGRRRTCRLPNGHTCAHYASPGHSLVCDCSSRFAFPRLCIGSFWPKVDRWPLARSSLPCRAPCYGDPSNRHRAGLSSFLVLRQHSNFHLSP